MSYTRSAIPLYVATTIIATLAPQAPGLIVFVEETWLYVLVGVMVLLSTVIVKGLRYVRRRSSRR